MVFAAEMNHLNCLRAAEACGAEAPKIGYASWYVACSQEIRDVLNEMNEKEAARRWNFEALVARLTGEGQTTFLQRWLYPIGVVSGSAVQCLLHAGVNSVTTLWSLTREELDTVPGISLGARKRLWAAITEHHPPTRERTRSLSGSRPSTPQGPRTPRSNQGTPVRGRSRSNSVEQGFDSPSLLGLRASLEQNNLGTVLELSSSEED